MNETLNKWQFCLECELRKTCQIEPIVEENGVIICMRYRKETKNE